VGWGLWAGAGRGGRCDRGGRCAARGAWRAVPVGFGRAAAGGVGDARGARYAVGSGLD
jgi:hypothetical protein